MRVSVYHVLNRAVGRATLFDKPADYAAFEKVIREAWQRTGMRLLSYLMMPNHWHLVAWPSRDGQLSEWAQWLTVTHVRRWHAHHHTVGTGPVYQGRFKSFPIQEGEHYFTVCRYVERNALRANLVARAEDWRWSSLWHRHHATQAPWLSEGPLPLPADWIERINEVQTEAELAALRRSVSRGAPFGDESWQERTANALDLQSALPPRGRPRKTTEASRQ
jgi:putative transposase